MTGKIHDSGFIPPSANEPHASSESTPVSKLAQETLSAPPPQAEKPLASHTAKIPDNLEDELKKYTSTMSSAEKQDFETGVASLLDGITNRAVKSSIIREMALSISPSYHTAASELIKPFIQNIPNGFCIRDILRSISLIPEGKRQDALNLVKPLLKYIKDGNKNSLLIDIVYKLSSSGDVTLLERFLMLEKNENEKEDVLPMIAYKDVGQIKQHLEKVIKPLEKSVVQFNRKMLANVFTFDGVSKIDNEEFKLTGQVAAPVKDFLQKRVEDFYGTNHATTKILSQCMNYQDLDQRIDQDRMVALYGSWKNKEGGHGVGAVIFKEGNDFILARCNKGERVEDQPGIRFDKIGKPDAIHDWMKQFGSMPNKEHFLDAGQLELTPCKNIPPLEQKDQTVGNCAVASYNSLERAILYVQNRQQGQDHTQASSKSKETHQARAHMTALSLLEEYLQRYEGGKNHEQIDYNFIGKLFMKTPHRQWGDYEEERLARLERWVLKANFSDEEFEKLKKGLRSAAKEVMNSHSSLGARSPHGGDVSDAALTRRYNKLIRLEFILKNGGKQEAIEILDKCISEKSFKDKEERLDALQSKIHDRTNKGLFDED